MTYAGDIQVNRDPNLRKWHGTLLDSDGTPTQCWIYSGTYGVEGGPIDDHHHIINEPHGTLRLMIERSEYVVDSSDLATLEQLLAEWMIGEGVPIPVDMAYTVHMDTLRDEAGDTVIENLPDPIIRQDRPTAETIDGELLDINQIQLNDGSHWWNLDGSCLLWGPFVSKSDADTHRTHVGYMG